jgi:hypothetical protein
MEAMNQGDNFHSAVIRSLGGKTRLAEALGLGRDVLTKWHVRGIPSKYWHRVIELAASASPPIDLTADDLSRSKPETSSRASEASVQHCTGVAA